MTFVLTFLASVCGVASVLLALLFLTEWVDRDDWRRHG